MNVDRFTSGMIAAAVGGELRGRADLVLGDVAGIEQSKPDSLTFIRTSRYASKWATSKAAAAVVNKGVEVAGHDPATRALIVVDNADLAMLKLLKIVIERMPMHTPTTGVHQSAVIDPSAKIPASAKIGAHCTIGPGTVLGEGVVLMPNVTLGANVKIGDGTILHPGTVVFDRCTIGRQCILYSNVSIGADGFGYLPDPSGRGLLKVPHIGDVVIGDQVEIGANSCVDRGKFGSTTIGDQSKIDNLVQIGHNCKLGRCVMVCGTTGIAGSVTIGDGSIIGGHVGIADNLTLGAGVRIGAKSGVFENVPAGETWTGLPACSHFSQMRTWAAARKLPEILRMLKHGVSPAEAASATRRDLHL